MKRLLPLLGLLIALSSISSCSRKSAIEAAVESATSELKAGSRIAFMNLANNGKLENITVRKVEGSWILVTDDGTTRLPYWVNLSEVVAFREQSGDTHSAQRESEPPPDAPRRLRRVQTRQELADLLAKISVPTPGGKKWDDLGDLERQDWAAALTRAAPDVMFPASAPVASVEWANWSGLYQVDTPARNASFSNTPDAEFKLAGHPFPLAVALPRAENPGFAESYRGALEPVKSGQELNYWAGLRIGFVLNRQRDRLECTIQNLGLYEL